MVASANVFLAHVCLFNIIDYWFKLLFSVGGTLFLNTIERNRAFSTTLWTFHFQTAVIHTTITVINCCQIPVHQQAFSANHWTFYFESVSKKEHNSLQKCHHRHIFPISMHCNFFFKNTRDWKFKFIEWQEIINNNPNRASIDEY